MKNFHDEPSQPACRHQGTDHQRRAPNTSRTHGLLQNLADAHCKRRASTRTRGSKCKKGLGRCLVRMAHLFLVGPGKGLIRCPARTRESGDALSSRYMSRQSDESEICPNVEEATIACRRHSDFRVSRRQTLPWDFFRVGRYTISIIEPARYDA